MTLNPQVALSHIQFLLDGNAIEIGPASKKRRVVPAEANKMHVSRALHSDNNADKQTEVLQYLENFNASRDPVATTSSNPTSESTPRDAEVSHGYARR